MSVPAVEYKAPGYILANRNASLLVLSDVQGTIIFWTPVKQSTQDNNISVRRTINARENDR